MTETIEDRILRLLREAGVDPLKIPIDGPIDEHGYPIVREPHEVVGNRIVTDWHHWDPATSPDLIRQIVDTFTEYQEARTGPVGRHPQEPNR